MKDLAVHQLVSAMNCFTNGLICPFEMDLVLYNVRLNVFEHDYCCSSSALDDNGLNLPELVLV